ncbi:hypothetical protein [Streptomyces sp. NPDC057199]|uniref:hypothetical protein n=1 Tax=Streptomyces sp. NPDC057199 TaxID=3346047 RepID=UPI00362805A5
MLHVDNPDGEDVEYISEILPTALTGVASDNWETRRTAADHSRSVPLQRVGPTARRTAPISEVFQRVTSHHPD